MRPRAVLLIDAANYILSASAADTEYDEEYAWRRAQRVIASVVGFFSLPNDTICAYIGDGEIAVLKASGTRDLASWTRSANEKDQANRSPSAPSSSASARNRLTILPVESAATEGATTPEAIYCASWADLGALKRASAALLKRLRHDTGAPVSIGVGRYHPGIRALTASYQDARAALSLGRRFHGQNRVHCLDALGVAAFVGVADERTKIDLAIHLLSPLDHEVELLDTLDVFFAENCSPSTTASRLNIHRNTLGYRLDKITALTGLDPRHFDDAVQIRIALTLRALHTSRTPAYLDPPERATF